MNGDQNGTSVEIQLAFLGTKIEKNIPGSANPNQSLENIYFSTNAALLLHYIVK